MANRYANLVGSNKIKDEYQKINQGFDRVQQDVDQLQDDLTQEVSDREAAVQAVDERVDEIIQGGGPDKDPELVDIRTPDPSYTPEGPISTAGGMTRDMQRQFVAHKADIAIHRPIKFFEDMPTPNDLADGEIGLVEVQERSASTAFKNLFINGAMDIWQRGTGPFSGTQIYTADRWVSGNQSQNVIERREDAPEGFRYSLYFQRNSSISAFQQDQRIESVNCIPLVGETVTISFWAKRGLNDPNAIRVRLFHADSPDDFSSFTQFHQSNVQALTDEWQRYSFTVESLPNEVKNGIRVFIQVQTGDTFPQAVQITGCQFELGDKATPFEHRDIGTELALCQRYFQLRSTDDVDPLDLRPTMRITPTITGSESPYSYDAEL